MTVDLDERGMRSRAKHSHNDDQAKLSSRHRHTPIRFINLLLYSYFYIFSNSNSFPYISKNIFKKEIPYRTTIQELKMPLIIPNITENPSDLGTLPTTDNTSTSSSNCNTNATSSTSTQKTPEQEEADRLYEERIEEEYAKREGGA